MDVEVYRILQSIQNQLDQIHREREMTLIILSRLNVSVEALTDEMRNINHLLAVINKRLIRVTALNQRGRSK